MAQSLHNPDNIKNFPFICAKFQEDSAEELISQYVKHGNGKYFNSNIILFNITILSGVLLLFFAIVLSFVLQLLKITV